MSTDPGKCYATGVELGEPTVAGGKAPIKVWAFRADGKPLDAAYPLGATVVFWKAVDVHGHFAVCTQKVVVRDTEPPAIACPPDVTVPDGASTDPATGFYSYWLEQGQYTVTASAAGYVSAHWMLRENPPDDETARRVRLDELEALAVGAVGQVDVVPVGPAVAAGGVMKHANIKKVAALTREEL